MEEESKNFFKKIYKGYDDGWKKTVKKRQKLARKNPFTVALHGSHMSIESIYENRESVHGDQIKNECSSGGDCRNIIFAGTVQLQNNEFIAHLKGLPGHSSCDLDLHERHLLPASFLMNGSNYTPMKNGEIVRSSPINQLDNTPLLQEYKKRGKNVLPDINTIAKLYGINMLWGENDSVPNYSMAGDHTLFSPGIIFMSTYVILWGIEDHKKKKIS